MKEYSTYRGLPALAGVCAMEEAMVPGLSVEKCVGRLKRFHYATKRLREVFNARITAEPLMELKMGFSHHAWLCAEHATALRLRVGEMREPPLGLDETPHGGLEIFFDEILAAPTTEELLAGLYGEALSALRAAMEQYRAESNPLADQPSRRMLRFLLLDVEDMLAFGDRALASLKVEREGEWVELLRECLVVSGGIDGTIDNDEQEVRRHHSKTPYVHDGVPQRDERFPDPYNMGVNAEVFLYDETMPPVPKTLMMFYKRLREVDVPEMMASIIAETPSKPWGYYRDMTRQLWDEARHAMMGEVGFVSLGIDWSREVMVNHTWSLALNTQLAPQERHAVLYFIEQGLMSRTGKRFEWEVGQASGNPLSALFQDFDWADEVLHARIGRDWYLPEFENPKEALDYGDECWSRVLMNWSKWREDGLTEHRNWWPGCYRAACQAWGEKPDEKVLAFGTTYEDVRADLKGLSASG